MEPAITPLSSLNIQASELLKQTNFILARRQLYVLPPGSIRKALGKDQLSEQDFEALPIEQVLHMLPLAHKISALYRSIGIESTYTNLSLHEACLSLCREKQEPQSDNNIEAIKRFQEEVYSLTEGVMTSYSMNPYRVLRMLLFAAVDRALKDTDAKKHLQCMSSNQSAQISFAESVEKQKEILCELFYRFDLSFFIEEDPSIDREIHPLEIYFSSYLEALPKELERSKSDINLILQILRLLQKAANHPYTYLPILLRPLQALPLTCNGDADIGSLSPKSASWLNDFTIALRVQTEQILKYCKGKLIEARAFEKSRQQFNAAATEIDRLNHLAQEMTANISKAMSLLQHFEQLAPDEQKKNQDQIDILLSLNSVNQMLIKKIDAQYLVVITAFEAIRGLLKKKNEKTDAVFQQKGNQGLQFPVHYYRNFCMFIMQAVLNSCQLIKLFHRDIKQILPAHHKCLGTVTLIDLIDFNLVQVYLQVRKQKKEDDDTINNLMVIKSRFQEIFTAMRRYYALTSFKRFQSHQDSFNNANYINACASIQEEVSSLNGTVSEPSAKRLLSLYAKTAEILSTALLNKRWPQLFIKSPFAASIPDFEAEKKYYHELQNLFEDEALTIDVEGLSLLFEAASEVLKLNETDTGLYEKEYNEILKLIQSLQEELKQKGKTPDNLLQKRGEAFWDSMARVGVILESMIDNFKVQSCDFEGSQNLKLVRLNNVTNHLEDIRKIFNQYFFSGGSALRNFLFLLACTDQGAFKAKPAKKIVTHRPNRPQEAKAQEAPLEKEKLAPLPKIPQTLQEKQKDFELAIHSLAHHCLDFTTTAVNKEQMTLDALQQFSAYHLKESLAGFKELFANLDAYGQYPFFLHTLYRNISAAMEQAAILTAANLKVYQEPTDTAHVLLKKMGKECYWQKHDPLLIAKAFEGKFVREHKKMLYDKATRVFIGSLSRVLGVTARYPASGNDELSVRLFHALRLPPAEENRIISQERLEKGLDGCLATFNAVMPKESYQKIEQKIPFEEVARSLRIELPAPSDWQNKIRPAINSLKDRVEGLQNYLAFPLNRFVPAIDAFDKSFAKRKGTIQTCLANLAMNIKLLEEIMLLPENPAFCLSLAESSLLYQAVLLEQSELILLSHLPCRSSPHASTHFLWNEKDQKPARYTHDMGLYSKVLSDFIRQQKIEIEENFFVESMNLSLAFTPYLQKGFRYYHLSPCRLTMLRDDIKTLAKLRSKVVLNDLTEAEGQAIDNRFKIHEKPQERLQKLDEYISLVLQTRIKQPAVRVLEIADRWLQIYEDLLSE